MTRLLGVLAAFVTVAAGVTWFMATAFGDLAFVTRWGEMSIDGEMVSVATPSSWVRGATIGLIAGFLAAVTLSAVLALLAAPRVGKGPRLAIAAALGALVALVSAWLLETATSMQLYLGFFWPVAVLFGVIGGAMFYTALTTRTAD